MSGEPERLNHYRIERRLGQGGMGIVYAAHDERLDRPVAIKMILDAASDVRGRERFWREARAAAAVNHPNVCQLYEIGEEGGQLFIAMELLEGESLAARLETGPIPIPEALSVSLAALGALEALHDRTIVHRDLKPSNVFLTKFGVKLLDFGLARAVMGDAMETCQDLTLPGNVVGTPAYMAPEQLAGHPSDARADLFAAGTMLYEMLTGKTPFVGATMVETMHAVLTERPPVLTGAPSVEAIDRVIQRALEKKPDDRYQTAAAMAADVRTAMASSDPGEMLVVRAVTRVIVLPFRVLRPDPETDFLAFGLADAITSSLTGVESLVVRSSLAAAAFADQAPDLKTIAAETDVDAVVAGTLMRAGDQIRVSAQLLEAPGGTVLWSQNVQSALGDLFTLQDDFTHRIVESLSVPLSRREEQMLKRDVPATARAYEYYLRANECGRKRATWQTARELYGQCVAEDPNFAPAWAGVGRIERLIGLYFDSGHAAEHQQQAEAAFKRALEINPDLPLAHNLYAYLQVDLGRGQEAMLQLLDCVHRQRADPDLFAGLVHVCRYCGLLDASIAAYEKAKHLDPKVRTSVCHSYWFAGDAERAEATDDAETPFMKILVRLRRGELDQVVGELEELNRAHRSAYGSGWELLISALKGNGEAFREGFANQAPAVTDPEGMYYWALMASVAGAPGEALDMLERAVRHGWMCYQPIATDPWLDPLRGDARFKGILKEAETRNREATAAFVQAGGDRLLGVKS